MRRVASNFLAVEEKKENGKVSRVPRGRFRTREQQGDFMARGNLIRNSVQLTPFNLSRDTSSQGDENSRGIRRPRTRDDRFAYNFSFELGEQPGDDLAEIKGDSASRTDRRRRYASTSPLFPPV